jgi:hypothetical protein
VWRVKLVAEFETGETTEVEVARLERELANSDVSRPSRLPSYFRSPPKPS